MDLKKFTAKSKTVHCNKYIYDLVDLSRPRARIQIICPDHGIFLVTPREHLDGKGCYACENGSDGFQPNRTPNRHLTTLTQFVKSVYSGEVIVRDEKVVSPYMIDIYIPEYNFGIEIVGNISHSFDHNETPEERDYLRNKHIYCKYKSLSLMEINEYEIDERLDVIYSMILNKLQRVYKVFARKCKVVKIDGRTHKQFIDQAHIYGQGGYPTVAYGLEYKDKLVSVMSFSTHKKYGWEINRFASKLGWLIVGGASKLFKAFVSEHHPAQVLTFADARFGLGNVYKRLGLINVDHTRPNYVYVKNGEHHRRQQFQKHKLKDKLTTFDPNLTEAQNVFNDGYRRLWDAGHYKYLLKPE